MITILCRFLFIINYTLIAIIYLFMLKYNVKYKLKNIFQNLYFRKLLKAFPLDYYISFICLYTYICLLRIFPDSNPLLSLSFCLFLLNLDFFSRKF